MTLLTRQDTHLRTRASNPFSNLWMPLITGTCLIASACGDGDGNLIVMVSGETNIRDGLEPGDELEHVRDGWRVRFEKWIAAVGDFEASKDDDHGHSHDHSGLIHDSTVHVIDMTAVPQGGQEIMRFDDIAATRWRHVSYATGIVTEEAERHTSVSEEDFQRMIDEEATYLLVGHIEKDDRRVDFDFAIPAATIYSECRPEHGAAGFSVPDGGTVSIALTLHGDHIFFNAFTTGSEGHIQRRAGWLARADIDEDGVVTREELEAIGTSQLSEIFPSSEYDLGGGGEILEKPDGIETAWDYVVAQMLTPGHFQGEGHCKIGDLDIEHSHSDD